MRDRACRHIFHVFISFFGFSSLDGQRLFLLMLALLFFLFPALKKKKMYKIWKYEFLLGFLCHRTQNDACRECESHGKHDFHIFFFLSAVSTFSFHILYSWHFVAHFSVHLVLAIFRPRSKKRLPPKNIETRAAKSRARTRSPVPRLSGPIATSSTRNARRWQ